MFYNIAYVEDNSDEYYYSIDKNTNINLIIIVLGYD